VVVNMMAMPAAGGGSRAVYLWKEAASLDTLDGWVAKTELDRLIEAGADFDDLVEAAYGERLARVQAAMPPPEHHHVLHGIEPGIDHALIWEKANDDVWAAIERYEAAQEQRITGIEYRQDTAPELVALIGIDPEAPPHLDDLKHLLAAKAADGEPIEGKRSYRTSGKERQTMGTLELLFSADKSVSVTFGLASQEERQAIVRAQATAVDAAMHQIADKIGFLRARRDGLDHRDPADLTWVQWQHRLSRRGDPQLHTHVSLLNVVRSRTEGKVGTLDTFALHGFYPKVRETYHRVLAIELGKLGLPAEFKATVPAAVLTNIPEPVLRHFSARSADAEQWLREKLGPNFATLTPRQRSVWLSNASAQTRPPKPRSAGPATDREAWKARASTRGYVPPQRFIDRVDRGMSAAPKPRRAMRGPWRFAYDDAAYKLGPSL
jgi:conjugative relaxase-like TrwC/TraI family protein